MFYHSCQVLKVQVRSYMCMYTHWPCVEQLVLAMAQRELSEGQSEQRLGLPSRLVGYMHRESCIGKMPVNMGCVLQNEVPISAIQQVLDYYTTPLQL